MPEIPRNAGTGPAEGSRAASTKLAAAWLSLRGQFDPWRLASTELSRREAMVAGGPGQPLILILISIIIIIYFYVAPLELV